MKISLALLVNQNQIIGITNISQTGKYFYFLFDSGIKQLKFYERLMMWALGCPLSIYNNRSLHKKTFYEQFWSNEFHELLLI
jgi:hypothetical protein